jgi:ankyrin repeat protein
MKVLFCSAGYFLCVFFFSFSFFLLVCRYCGHTAEKDKVLLLDLLPEEQSPYFTGADFVSLFLLQAAKIGDCSTLLSLARSLPEGGLDLSCVDEQGDGAGHIAARHSHLRFLLLLKENNANFQLMNARCRSVAHILAGKCVLWTDTEMEKRLQKIWTFLEDDDVLSLPDCEGNLPLHLAVSAGNVKAVSYLLGK